MKSSSQPSSDADQTAKEPRTTRSAAMLLVATAVDTTWRFFVPTIGGLLVGIGLDSLLHTLPIFTIIMVVVGAIVSGLLIARQLKEVRKEK